MNSLEHTDIYYFRRLKRNSTCKLLCSLIFIALLIPLQIGAQETKQTPSKSLTPSELERLLNEALIRASEYTTSFRELTAEEKQSVELYDAEGRLIRRREIVSDFVVYQSRFDKGVTAEYRNVREVDKVEVPGRDERVLKLFKKLANTINVNQEMELISDETSRYDLNYSVQGYTLKQGLPLQKEVRPAFNFDYAGSEEIDGEEAFVVKYTQREPSELLKVDLRIPSLPKNREIFYRGQLWLDTRTAQIRREEREIVIKLPNVKEPLVLIRQEFFYAPSQFGILIPKRITLVTLGSVKLDGDRVAATTIGGRMTYEYSPFSRFQVTIPGANVERER